MKTPHGTKPKLPRKSEKPADTSRSGLMISPDGRCEVTWDIPCEVPVAFIFNGLTHAVMMATPCDLDDFARGFSIAEGIINTVDEIAILKISARHNGIELALQIAAKRFERLELHRARRAHMGRTGCGLCGIDNLDDAVRPLPQLAFSNSKIHVNAILKAAGALNNSQPQRARNHTVHGAAWVSNEGILAHVREDIGRHNALDKMIGAKARANRDQIDGFALISSRCTFELVQKAALAGICVLASLSAPSEAAILTAQRCNLTLVSLDRNSNACVVFTAPGRLDS